MTAKKTVSQKSTPPKLTYRPDQYAVESIEAIKKLINEATASKAITHAVNHHVSLVKRVEKLEQTNHRLQYTLTQLQRQYTLREDAAEEIKRLLEYS